MAHIGRIQGATRVLGKSQGYYGLPVLDSVQQLDDLPQMLQTMGFDPVSGHCPVYQTVWFPDPDELARLNAGAGIHVSIVGIAVQPMMVNVGEPPQELDICPQCMGTGCDNHPDSGQVCTRCNGSGGVPISERDK